MYSFEEYLRDVLSAYDSSSRSWTQETRASNSLVSASYDSCHALHIAADRKLTLEELVVDDACERFASEIRLCVSRDALEGKTGDATIKSICEAAKRAIDAGIASNVSVVQASFRVVVARR